MRTAYSYIRFSTTSQEAGDSIRRQTEKAEAFCLKHGLLLSPKDRFEDKGVSAYKGKNADVGNLRRFIGAVERGEIKPGCVLVVENLDRLTRNEITEAMPLFTSIINLGVDIGITDGDGRIFTKKDIDASPFILIEILITLIRANQESRRKSELIRARWGQKKKAAATGIIMTTRCPQWLRVVDGKFEVIEERAEIVRKIFEMTAKEGRGIYQITKYLNEVKKAQPWGNGKKVGMFWQSSYVQKILANRSVLGELQIFTRKGKKRLEDGEPVKGYFPRIITPRLFTLAHSAKAERKGKPGRKSKRKDGGSLFTHLLRCGYTGQPVHYIDKGDWQYLVPAGCISGATPWHMAWVYQDFEKLFMDYVLSTEFLEVFNMNQTVEETETEGLEAEVKEQESKIQNLLGVIEASGSASIPALAKRLREAQEKLDALKATFAQKNMKDIKDAYVDVAGFIESCRDKAEEIKKDPELRARFKSVVLSAFQSIELYFEGDKDKFIKDRAAIALKIKTRAPGRLSLQNLIRYRRGHAYFVLKGTNGSTRQIADVKKLHAVREKYHVSLKVAGHEGYLVEPDAIP